MKDRERPITRDCLDRPGNRPFYWSPTIHIDMPTGGRALLKHGPRTDRRLDAGDIIVQAVSMPVGNPDVLVSEVCRSGFEHWRRLAGDDPMPDRASIDPARMRSLLPYTFLVDVLEDGGDFGYRLIGTNIVAHTPRDNTGLRLSQIEDQGSQVQLRALYASTLANRAPRVQRIAYRTRQQVRSWYETVVCPMRDRPADGGGSGRISLLIGWAEHFHQPVQETGG